MKRKPEHHEAGEICNLPVFKHDQDRAEGMIFKYTGVFNVDNDKETWGVSDGEIIMGTDGHTPTWKLEAVLVTLIPTPNDSL